MCLNRGMNGLGFVSGLFSRRRGIATLRLSGCFYDRFFGFQNALIPLDFAPASHRSFFPYTGNRLMGVAIYARVSTDDCAHGARIQVTRLSKSTLTDKVAEGALTSDRSSQPSWRE